MPLYVLRRAPWVWPDLPDRVAWGCCIGILRSLVKPRVPQGDPDIGYQKKEKLDIPEPHPEVHEDDEYERSK
jgi:hypothetical protein